MQSKNYRMTFIASYIGYITQAIVNNLAPLLFLIFRESFGIPLWQITFLITFNFAVQISVDFLLSRIADRMDYRLPIVLAHFFAAIGLCGMTVFPKIMDPFIGLLLAAGFYAVGGGAIEVLVSPIVEACPSDHKAAQMSLLHSFYCWGTVAVVLFSTLFLSVFGKESWQWLPIIWAVVPFANAFLFISVPLERLTEKGESMTLGELFKNRIFLILTVLMFCAGSSELGMSQWASAFAEAGLGVSKTVGDLVGPCLFSVTMGCARVFYAKFGDRIDLVRFLTVSGGLCVFAYLLSALAPLPFLSLIGCSLCGFSVGIMWPGVYSIGSAALPRGGTPLFSMLALAGDIGCTLGPTLVGEVSGLAGDSLKIGLLTAVVFPVLLLVFIVFFRKATKKAEN